MTSPDQTTLSEAQPPGDGWLRPGQRVGKCRIERELGRGGMGAVYLARHQALGMQVAVKVMHAGAARTQPELVERFLREARLAARLRHPNITSVLDVAQDPASGCYYIVQELVDGGSVRDLLARGPLAERDALGIAISVAKALVAAAEKGIVHRDIKPDNILISRQGRIKLADLGLAKELGQNESGLTVSSSTMGTPHYMSPEQVRDSKRVDPRSDIYSLGATLYHMLTGEPPFAAGNLYAVLHKVTDGPVPDPRGLRPEVSARLAAICMKMMAKEADARYPDARALLAALAPDDLRPGRQARRRQVRARSAPPRRSLDRGRLVALAVGLAVLLGVILAIFLRGGEEPGAAGPDTLAAGPVQPPEDPAPEPPPEDPAPDPAPERPEDPAPELPPEVLPEDPPEDPRPEAPPDDPTPEDPPPPPPDPRDGLRAGLVLAIDGEGLAGGRLPARVGPQGRATGARAVAGVEGQAVALDRAGRVALPALREGTVALWVRCDAPIHAFIYNGGALGARMQGFLLGIYGPETGLDHWPREGHGVSVGFWQVDVLVPAPAVVDGDWHFIALSWDGASQVEVCVDGAFPAGHIVDVDNSVRAFDNPFRLPEPASPAADSPSVIGHTGAADAFSEAFAFAGAFDELLVWERALSRAELEAYFASGASAAALLD